MLLAGQVQGHLVCNKTLSALYRHIVGDPCPKSAADTFREAPWQADDIRTPLRRQLIQTAFESTDIQADAKFSDVDLQNDEFKLAEVVLLPRSE